MKYKLSENLKIREADLAIFKFETAELIKFNEKGFILLNKILQNEVDLKNLTFEEKEFINNLIKINIITEV